MISRVRLAARLSLAACLALMPVGMAMAQEAGGYVCTIQQLQQNEGWFAETVTVRYPVNGNEAIVKDAVIDRFAQQTIFAKVETENDIRITFVWSLLTKDKRNVPGQRIFRLTIRKADLSAAMVTSLPIEWHDGNFRAEGKCIRRK